MTRPLGGRPIKLDRVSPIDVQILRSFSAIGNQRWIAIGRSSPNHQPLGCFPEAIRYEGRHPDTFEMGAIHFCVPFFIRSLIFEAGP